ncbi:cytochrome c maturation protein CcmE [Paracoccus sp. (in: a-proteobacteria)]|uniref:cytochrome c maturation protein CcmE n=1 Tax=Paracoccus sp. TaxID=267 RepID=UPI0026E0F64E|nr:cytochrome c maturation protein CcmE [Paracoccus sp. (in: a-proteobacteria)]MDO5369156.1 cytochrome c maturation protein CcmE [Paracoccus sp. (in: a-proteobacteria)]
MKSLKKKRRIQVLIAAAVALVMATVLIGYGFRDGINLYRSPSQLAEAPPPAGEVFRLGGLVEEGSITRGEGETVTFAVTDGGEVVPVSFRGVLPDLFAENAGMIGTGQMVDGVFVADEILAKHDENYMPREVADSLKEQGVYKEPTS